MEWLDRSGYLAKHNPSRDSFGSNHRAGIQRSDSI